MSIELKESYKTALIQTNHIQENDARNLDLMSYEDDNNGIACLPTGFILKLDKVPENNINKVFSDELNLLVVQAAKQGFGCIEFTSQCQKIEGIQVFHW